MGRRKKNPSSVLVGVVDDFYSHVAGGDPGKLKYSLLAQYAQDNGIDAKWYDFQRDDAVIRRIQELSETRETEEYPVITPSYKSLDIEEMLRNCFTVEDLTRRLYEMDCYWKKIYDNATDSIAEKRRLSRKVALCEAKILHLEEEKSELSNQVAEKTDKARKLKDECAYLRRILREYLYPAVARRLLREERVPVEESGDVLPEAFPKLLEGDTPQPFDGVRQQTESAPTRQEQLLAAMRKQVKEHGTQTVDSRRK